MSDPTRLRQLLLNIVGNATKFTDIGSITVTIGAELRENMPRIAIAVEDSGVGCAVEDAGRLFKPFTQGDASVTRKHGGTGLGLVICQRLAELMGGSVRLAWTVKGKGSCFRIEIPLIAAEGAVMIATYNAIHDEQRAPAAKGSVMLSGRILLAEDGPDNQRLISFHLRKAGAHVDIAEHGIQALEMIARSITDGRPYDLLLSDMQMPEMDGYTLARTLRTRGSTLPIIALTAHAMGEDRRKCIEAGCDDYATKPIDQCSLLAMCGRWIRPTDGMTPRTRAA
ncbi:MAG: ATP-binding protein [Phycisphaerae bacterium]|nr:ATP-binding protein [Phycisphaerae bacterium]